MFDTPASRLSDVENSVTICLIERDVQQLAHMVGLPSS